MLHQARLSQAISMTALVVMLVAVIISPIAAAAKVDISQFCPVLDGDWQGSAAKHGVAPREVTTSAICSSDKRNLMLTVSRGDSNPNSEVWWFRSQGSEVLLTYTDGVGEDREQLFSLYQRGDSFTFLGKGKLNQRPALIRLSFEPKASVVAVEGSSGSEQSLRTWLWRQSAHYLDDDSEQYQLIRAIELSPVSKPNQ
ncbi:hypothetical protein L2735_05115 [Shewanella olleyana]|uniref:hypothetical protein n=1 Tax=Shewanella olleyana TaxID=135626 RepID=UPI00200F1DEA|nr:hypothetical protein [Shewanella olleyana]MCL1066188.1 hypothetical protein [Shewanella olleyana]